MGYKACTKHQFVWSLSYGRIRNTSPCRYVDGRGQLLVYSHRRWPRGGHAGAAVPVPSLLGRRGSHKHRRNRGLATRGRRRPGRLVGPAHGWESRRLDRRRVVSRALGLHSVGGITRRDANAIDAAAGCDRAILPSAAVQARRARRRAFAGDVCQTLAARLGRCKAAAAAQCAPSATLLKVVRILAQERRLAGARLQRAVRPAREVSQDVASLAHDALLGVAVALGAPNPAFLAVFWGRRGPLGIWGGRRAGGTKIYTTPSVDGGHGWAVGVWEAATALCFRTKRLATRQTEDTTKAPTPQLWRRWTHASGHVQQFMESQKRSTPHLAWHLPLSSRA